MPLSDWKRMSFLAVEFSSEKTDVILTQNKDSRWTSKNFEKLKIDFLYSIFFTQKNADKKNAEKKLQSK